LHRLNRPRRHQEEHHHSQHRDHGPGEFDLITPVHLWWLIGISATATKPDEDIGQEADDDHKNASADPQHQPRKFKDGLGWCRNGIEDVGKVYRPIHNAYVTA
jgi:hypothetical protein